MAALALVLQHRQDILIEGGGRSAYKGTGEGSEKNEPHIWMITEVAIAAQPLYNRKA